MILPRAAAAAGLCGTAQLLHPGSSHLDTHPIHSVVICVAGTERNIGDKWG